MQDRFPKVKDVEPCTTGGDQNESVTGVQTSIGASMSPLRWLATMGHNHNVTTAIILSKDFLLDPEAI